MRLPTGRFEVDSPFYPAKRVSDGMILFRDGEVLT